MKFCPSCGTQLPDDAMFCNTCGNKLDAAPAPAAPAENSAPAQPATPAQPTAPVQPTVPVQPVAPQYSAPKAASSMTKNAKVGLIAIIAAVAVVAIIVIIILTSIFGGPKGAIKSFFKDFQSGTTKWIWDAAPRKVIAEYLDYERNVDIDDYESAYGELCKATWDAIEKEGDVDFTYDIKALENIEELKKLKGETYYSSLRDMKSRLKNAYEKYDFEDDELTDAYIAKINYEFSVDGERLKKGSIYCAICKYDGDWYVFKDDFASIFDIGDVYNALREKFPDAAKEIIEAKNDIEKEYEGINLQ